MVAKCNSITGNFDQGLEECRKVWKEFPRYSSLAFSSKCQVVHWMTYYKKYDDAIQLGLEVCRDYCYVSKDSRAWAHFSLGEAYSARGDHGKALDTFEAALGLCMQDTADMIAELNKVLERYRADGLVSQTRLLQELIDRHK